VVSGELGRGEALAGWDLGAWVPGLRAECRLLVSWLRSKNSFHVPGGAHGACSLTSTYRCLKKYSLSSVSGCLRPELPF
jgi:hypothetical protein